MPPRASRQVTIKGKNGAFTLACLGQVPRLLHKIPMAEPTRAILDAGADLDGPIGLLIGREEMRDRLEEEWIVPSSSVSSLRGCLVAVVPSKCEHTCTPRTSQKVTKRPHLPSRRHVSHYIILIRIAHSLRRIRTLRPECHPEHSTFLLHL